MDAQEVDRLLTTVVTWSDRQHDIDGLALVGSWAKGTARPDSDLDLVLITTHPQTYRRNGAWMTEIPWSEAGFELASWQDKDYGAIWSRHLLLSPDAEVEMSFCSPGWASVAPMDEGTREVVTPACRVLTDKKGYWTRLLQAIR